MNWKSLQKFLAVAPLLMALPLRAQLLEPPRGNVLIYEADPFLLEGAPLLGGFSVPDWSSSPVGLPGTLTVVAEHAGATGLSSPGVVPLAPLPARSGYALVNQFAPDIAIFNYFGRVLVSADADGNGLNDAWEQRYGLHDPKGDADGDGFTNQQEHDAGTNPLDPQEHPDAAGPKLEISLSRGAIDLNWTDPKSVLQSASSVDGPWEPVPQATSPYSPPILGSAKFFRLAEEP